jgi:DNA repair photolyase
MTMTTFDEKLCRIVEPNVCTTQRRFEVLMEMKKMGIPTVVWLSPFLPYINDNEENLMGLLNYCAEAEVKGIVCFGIGMTLREGNREYYYAALDRHWSGISNVYRREYGNSYEIVSRNNDGLMSMLHDFCDRHSIICDVQECFGYLNEFPEKYEQLSLF